MVRSKKEQKISLRDTRRDTQFLQMPGFLFSGVQQAEDICRLSIRRILLQGKGRQILSLIYVTLSQGNGGGERSPGGQRLAGGSGGGFDDGSNEAEGFTLMLR